MIRILLALIVFISTQTAFGLDDIPMPTSVTVAGSTPTVPDKYKDFAWRRAETDNFEILALDEQHSKVLSQYLEPLKSWILTRWGLPDAQFNNKCMVICVPSQDIFKEFFRRDDVDPKVTVSKNPDGTDRPVYCIWVAAGPDTRWLTSIMSEKVSRICLLNHEAINHMELAAWAHVGMSALDNDVATVKSLLGSLDPGSNYESASLFAMTKTDYDSKNLDEKLDIRRRAAALCLLARKEFGSTRFNQFLTQSSVNQPAVGVFGFAAIQDFDKSYNSYCRNLAFDIRQNVTPDSYLTWFFMQKLTR